MVEVELRFIPTYACWLNLIEPWWKQLRSLALKGRRFEGVNEVIEAIIQATTYWNAHRGTVVRGAAGRLVLLYLPIYSPWLNPVEMLWRHFRREATHCELFESVKALLAAAQDFFARYNREPHRILSIIGAIPKN
jgi:transposase